MPKLTPTVKHLVAEMRYEPNLAFYGVMDKIGLDFASKYPDWQRSPLTLELRDKKRKRRGFLAYERSFYEAVGYGPEGPEIEQARDLFAKVHHALGFSKVRRFGFRRMRSYATTEEFPHMVRAVTQKFGPKSEHLDKALRGKVEDFGYVVNVRSDEGWKYHLRLGPMERKQWFELIPYELGMFDEKEFLKFREEMPERMYFVDLDCYQEDITYSDIQTVLSSIVSKSEELIADLLDLLEKA
jgi:hypothetical protein